MKIKISDIVINGRVRKELGDIASLSASIAEVGLLHPVALTTDNKLLAGYRRLIAVRDVLGQDSIEATVVSNIADTLTELKAERDENVCRLNFTPSEAVAMGRAIEPLEREAARERKQLAGQIYGKGQIGSVNFTEPIDTPGRALDRVAAAVGMSRPTYEKAKAVVEAAEADPELLFLVNEMDKTGKVSSAHKKANKIKSKKQAAITYPVTDYHITLLEGDMLNLLADYKAAFDLVIADPPYNVTGWEWDKLGSPAVFLRQVREWLRAIKPTLKPDYNLFFFCSPQFCASIERLLTRLGYPIKSRVIWHRRNMAKGSHAKDKFIDTWEMIFHCGNRSLNFPDNWSESWFDVQTFAVPQTNFDDTKLHPTQKPLELIHRLVEFGSYPGDKILDPFAGSGTTGEAGQELRRDCVLIEREADYCSIIRQRLGIK